METNTLQNESWHCSSQSTNNNNDNDNKQQHRRLSNEFKPELETTIQQQSLIIIIHFVSIAQLPFIVDRLFSSGQLN